MSHERHAIHAVVHGIVQGVNFRYHTKATATQLGVVGWVRNLPDGTVEVVAEGEQYALDQLIVFLRRGPTHAVVLHVDLSWEAPTYQYQQFLITR